MPLCPVPSLLCGLLLYGSLCTSNSTLPQKIVSHHNDLKSFREDGIFDYSTMLIREDLDMLLLGATDAIFALDLNNISVKMTAVHLPVKEHSWCLTIHYEDQAKCRNYIRVLHKLNETTMYVCVTNAWRPACDYMTFVDGQLMLKGMREDGMKKCPSDPFQRYSSLMVGRDLYSGLPALVHKETIPVHSADSEDYLINTNWHSNPTFVHMEFVAESFESQDGDDDKIYLFFRENVVEDTRKVVLTRVARVCKGDLGGSTTKHVWTSFLKADLDCSLSETSLPPIVQDVFLLKNDDWRKSVFYAVFTTPSSSSLASFVCAYSVSAIRKVFNEGQFKTTDGKSVVPAGKVPVPRPGSCINDVARNMGIMSSRQLTEKSTIFIHKHPLIDEAVQPLTGGPLLVMKGPLLTQIVVDRVMALDGQNYTVMFVGTENGFVNKAVNYDGQMFIIEEIKLYDEPVPISTLHLSQSKGQIYAGSQFGAVQMPLSNCSRYVTCVDCVLAKDPYCAWDLATKQCSAVTGLSNTAVQSLMEGDSTQCPQLDPVMVVNLALVPGNNIQLLCQAHSNLAQVHWKHSGQTLYPNDKYYFYNWGLLVVNATTSDAGLYICDSVEQTASRIYNRTMGAYQLQLSTVGGPTTPRNSFPRLFNSYGTSTTKTGSISHQDIADLKAESQSNGLTGLEVAVIVLSLVCFIVITVFIWTWSKGHFGCLKLAQSTSQSQVERQSVEYMHIQNRTSETRRNRPQSVTPLNANNNHSAVDFKGNGGHLSTPMPNISTLDGLGFIHDESEI